jgi:hypothetical protein
VSVDEDWQISAEQSMTQVWKSLERSPEDAAAVPASARAIKAQREVNMMMNRMDEQKLDCAKK